MAEVYRSWLRSLSTASIPVQADAIITGLTRLLAAVEAALVILMPIRKAQAKSNLKDIQHNYRHSTV